MDTCDQLLLLLNAANLRSNTPSSSMSESADSSITRKNELLTCKRNEMPMTHLPTLPEDHQLQSEKFAINISDSSQPSLTPTAMVVMQWKSHACLQRMSQLLSSHPKKSPGCESQEGRWAEEGAVAMVAALADQGISLALESCLSHQTTRTLVLVFNAVMVGFNDSFNNDIYCIYLLRCFLQNAASWSLLQIFTGLETTFVVKRVAQFDIIIS